MTRTGTDAALAFCIGALVGVGAALLLESRDDEADRASFILRELRRQGFSARIARGDDRRIVRTAVDSVRRVSRQRPGV